MYRFWIISIGKALCLKRRLVIIISLLLLSFVAVSYTYFWQLSVVRTSSMAPAIKRGSLVITDIRGTPNHVKPGDIVTYVDPLNTAKTITHRLLRIEQSDARPPIYVFKGDANPASDIPVEQSALLGKVHLSIPYVGFIVSFLHTWLGLALFVYLPTLSFIGYKLYNLFNQKQRRALITSSRQIAALSSGLVVRPMANLQLKQNKKMYPTPGMATDVVRSRTYI